MSRRHGERNPNPGNSSPMLFYLMLAVIILALAAFLVLRPHGTGTGIKQNQTPAAPR